MRAPLDKEYADSNWSDEEIIGDIIDNNGGYWSEGGHPDYPVEDWQFEVTNGDTRMGYWEWVAHTGGAVQ